MKRVPRLKTFLAFWKWRSEADKERNLDLIGTIIRAREQSHKMKEDIENLGDNSNVLREENEELRQISIDGIEIAKVLKLNLKCKGCEIDDKRKATFECGSGG